MIIHGAVNRARATIGDLIFTAYVGLLLLLTLPLLWAALVVLAQGQCPARLIRQAARFVLYASGCRLRVHDTERLRDCGTSVLVANHSSYLDAIVLMAALPPGYRFVVNHRFAAFPLFGLAIRKAGRLVVDRTQAAARRACALAMIDTLRGGTSLLVFPEGARHRGSELLPFQLGAFGAAVEMGRPVVPITLTGTPDIWPFASWVVHRGSVDVRIHAPIEPVERGRQEIVRVRDQAHLEILRGLHESPARIAFASTKRVEKHDDQR